MFSTRKLSVPQSIPYMDQVDNLSKNIQPEPTETFDVGLPISGLPHTQGIQGNSGILIYFLYSGKLRKVLIFLKKSGKF